MTSEFEGLTTRVIGGPPALELLGVDLLVVDGPDRGKRLRVPPGVARVGTAPACPLRLSDPTVSRLHCALEARADGVRLTDSGSTNGTLVDGVRVRDADLAAGALVRIGATTLRVELGGDPIHVELPARQSFGGLVGGSVAMRRVYGILERAAPTDATVLVQGETGTGKELVARALHDASRRASRAFVAVDCGAIAETLIESELFGHVRGAFSGAVSDRKGVFEEADKGTLFLDEIGELPLSLQPKLLRLLETREVRRVGANTARRVDVRVVAATNRTLASSVNDGSFREDLYYRLAVVEVELPPLRARREDLPALARHFFERLGGVGPLPAEMASALATRSFPGNVRELRNYVERSLTLGSFGGPPAAASAAGGPPAPGAAEAAEAAMPIHLPLKEARLAWTEQFEGVYVRALLRRTAGNVSRAAEMAGVNRRFLQRMMARLGIRSAEPPEPGDDGDG